MRNGQCAWIFLLMSAAGVASALTPDTPANPYQLIVDRNVFGLKPPPPPPDPEAAKPPPSKITLTGITTILGNKRALMKTPPPPGKPGEAAKTEQSFILAEGERGGDIEVIEIDEKSMTVKVNNAGVVESLNFEKNGAKLPATAPPQPPPGAAPGVPPGGIPAPAVHSMQAPGRDGLNLPTRTLRAGDQAAGGSAGFGIPQAGAANSVNPQGFGQAVPVRSAEETALLYEANRLKNEQLRQSGVPMPPMPQHPALGGVDQQNPTQTPAPSSSGFHLPFPPGVIKQGQ
jgi:hypothetical protein